MVANELQRNGRVDVIDNAWDVVIPAIRTLRQVDRAGDPHSQRCDVVQRKLIKPLWRSPDSQIKLLTTGSVLPKSNDGLLDDTVAVATHDILVASSNAFVLSSVLVAETVFGGSNDPHGPKFGTEHLEVIYGLTGGIHAGDKQLVLENLGELDRLMNPEKKKVYGEIYREDGAYNHFGKLASAAKMMDVYYFPAINDQQATNPQVDNTVVYGSISAFRGVLGGQVSNSVVGIGPNGDRRNPFSNSHVKLENVIVINEDGGDVTLLNGGYGNHDLASEVVEEVGRLPKKPLASIAA